jgi:Flp pilus assembly protein TadB
MSYYSDEQLAAFRLLFWGAFILSGVFGVWITPHSSVVPAILCPFWLAAWFRLRTLKKRRAAIERDVAATLAQEAEESASQPLGATAWSQDQVEPS